MAKKQVPRKDTPPKLPGRKRAGLVRLAFRVFYWGLGLFVATTFLYVLYLRWFPPLTTPLMIMRCLEKKPGVDKSPFVFDARWRSWEELADQVKVAVIADEDQKFATHYGFDFDAMWMAAQHNWSSDKKVGGSTLSQQVAKNVFLWPSRTYIRKGLEVYFTALIELLWNKKRILEMYLNVAETGNGHFGMESGARLYFRKNARYLTASEAALLAAVLPSPRRYAPGFISATLAQKRRMVLVYMRMIHGTAYLKQIE